MRSGKSSLTFDRVLSLACAVLLPISTAFATTEKVVYSFQGSPDGSSPQASLVADSSGNLYGTTEVGGAGFGTVFELSPPATAGGAWTEQVLHAFQNDSIDGTLPTGTLVSDKEGNLYGTTQQGGPHNTGTIFELSPPATAGGEFFEGIFASRKIKHRRGWQSLRHDRSRRDKGQNLHRLRRGLRAGQTEDV